MVVVLPWVPVTPIIRSRVGGLAVHQGGDAAEHRPDLGDDEHRDVVTDQRPRPSASVTTATAPASRACCQYVAPWPCAPGSAA